MFAQNPVYVAYESLLKRLHRLIAEGKEDSEEADVVREAMERPFQQLGQAEQVRLNNLSGDLYQLQGDEVYVPVADPAERTRSVLEPALSAALRSQDWETVLSLLRKGPDFLPEHNIAFYRANAYENLGHQDTALLFMQYASEQKPQDASYKAYALRLLCDLRRADEAIAQAYYCMSDPNSEPKAFILSAFVLYNSTQDQALNEAKHIYVQVISVLEQALQAIVPSDELPIELIAPAYVVLGYAQEAVGQTAQAHLAYTQALQHDPANQFANIALSSLSQRSAEMSEKAFGLELWRELPTDYFGSLPSLRQHSGKQTAQLPLAA